MTNIDNMNNELAALAANMSVEQAGDFVRKAIGINA